MPIQKHKKKVYVAIRDYDCENEIVGVFGSYKRALKSLRQEASRRDVCGIKVYAYNTMELIDTLGPWDEDGACD